MKLATFDIFDTCLIRKCGKPEVVPNLVAQKLWPNEEKYHQEYIIARKQAAKKVGINATIKDIYSQDTLNCFPNCSPEELMQVEMDMESEMLVGNPEIKERINHLREEGYVIKFLSDMYLPSEFIKIVLEREDILKKDDEIIISCEWGERKDTGGLYKKVKEKYHPEKWVHFGDNLYSDVKIARKNGVKAIRINTGFTPIEKKFMGLGKDSRHEFIYLFLAGLMRYGRLRQNIHPEIETEAGAVLAADFIAPLYVSYLAFILKESKARGIKKLHFLSRDGFIMHEIAKTFNQEDIKLNYLFVSRKSLTPAFLTPDLKENFLKITDRQHLIGRSVDFLLDSLRLNRVMLEKNYGIKFKYNKILSLKQQEDFLNKVFDNAHLKDDLTKDFNKERERVFNYLSQEGLDDGKSQAMVDIGWLGTTRLMINSILSQFSLTFTNSENFTKLPTFYLGVRNDVYPRTCGDFYSYFPLGALSTDSTGLIENYYSASPWPSTMGYEKKSEEIKPIFKNGEEYKMTPIIETNVKISGLIAKEMKPYLEHFDDEILFQWAKITVESLSTLEFSVDLTPMAKATEFDGIPMVKKLTIVELMNMIFLGGRISAFDRGSLEFTIGNSLSKKLWTLHLLTGKLRFLGYKLYLKLKNK